MRALYSGLWRKAFLSRSTAHFSRFHPISRNPPRIFPVPFVSCRHALMQNSDQRPLKDTHEMHLCIAEGRGTGLHIRIPQCVRALARACVYARTHTHNLRFVPNMDIQTNWLGRILSTSSVVQSKAKIIALIVHRLDEREPKSGCDKHRPPSSATARQPSPPLVDTPSA